MTGLQSRNLLPELMDQPGLDEAEHHAALAGLGRVNTITRSSNMLWPAIAKIAEQRLRDRREPPLRILDIASGGGDVTCALATRAERAQVAVEISGCDISPVAIAYAEKQAANRGRENVTFFVHDILTEDLPETYDVIVCSLFLHHLDQDEAVTLLERMKQSATGGAFVSDLRRTSLGYAMAYVGTRLLSRSRIVHYDGPQSVAGAFTNAEALALAKEAGWTNATIRNQWPQRFLLEWNKPPHPESETS